MSSIVWVDAFKPENAQRPIDLTNEAFRKLVVASVDKGEAGFPPPPKLPPIFVNEKDRDYVDSKLTAHPVGTYMQPIKLSGVQETVAKKTYIRATKYPNPAFDKALAECKFDKSWTTYETNAYHIVMLDEPQWLADTLQRSARVIPQRFPLLAWRTSQWRERMTAFGGRIQPISATPSNLTR